jgi:hypothetical protein
MKKWLIAYEDSSIAASWVNVFWITLLVSAVVLARSLLYKPSFLTLSLPTSLAWKKTKGNTRATVWHVFMQL